MRRGEEEEAIVEAVRERRVWCEEKVEVRVSAPFFQKTLKLRHFQESGVWLGAYLLLLSVHLLPIERTSSGAYIRRTYRLKSLPKLYRP